jgi:phytoene dehydrogenase-like protein
MNKTEQLIEEYLSDKTKLYQDWYKELQQLEEDSDTELFAPLPSEQSIRERFKKWFEKNKELLREKICIKWECSNKKDEYQKISLLIKSLAADGLAVLLSISPTNLVRTAIILVVEGYLDKLCSH